MNEVTLYFRSEDGSVSRRVSCVPGDSPYTKPGAVPISKDEYEQRLAEILAVREAHVAGLLEQEEQQQRDDYEALIALKVPVATARRLTGYVAGA
ncbi:hypothetical protein [Streptomyces parvulus]|uniref:hypothetical protein n=1 Tax=Streptomyces parvulus TaxID=146923 RepID=UPI0038191413